MKTMPKTLPDQSTSVSRLLQSNTVGFIFSEAPFLKKRPLVMLRVRSLLSVQDGIIRCQRNF